MSAIDKIKAMQVPSKTDSRTELGDIGFGTPNTGSTKLLAAEPGVAEGLSTSAATEKATLPTIKHTTKNA